MNAQLSLNYIERFII